MDARDFLDIKILLKEKWDSGFINEQKLTQGISVEDSGNTLFFKGDVKDLNGRMSYEISVTLKNKETLREKKMVLYSIKFSDPMRLTGLINNAVNSVSIREIEMSFRTGGKSKKRKRRSKRSRRRSRRK
jgi:hypothetical protein